MRPDNSDSSYIMRILAQPAFKSSNPYTRTIYQPMTKLGVVVDEFSPVRLLLGNYDIWHRHWPDRSLNHLSRVKVFCKVLAAILCTLIARFKGTRIVWTVHNLETHEKFYPRLERWYWRFFIRTLDGYISLSETALLAAQKKFPELSLLPGFVVPHSNYRDRYDDSLTFSEARNRLNLRSSDKVILLIGKLRAYKNAPALIRVFRQLADQNALLYVVGNPSDPSVAKSIKEASLQSNRVRLVLRYIEEDEVQLYLRAADLVVLPYREVLNSGSALLALSFDCPVLVPALGSLSELQSYVGKEWVMTYGHDFTPEILQSGLNWALNTTRSNRAPLDGLNSKQISNQTAEAYRSILDEYSDRILN